MGMMYGGGYGDSMSDAGGATGASGKFAFITKFFDSLPPWLSTIVIILLVVLAAWIIGKIIGKIIGNLIYPDPDKETVFNLKQRLIIFAIVLATLGISGALIYNSQKPKDIESSSQEVMGDGIESSMTDTETTPSDTVTENAESSLADDTQSSASDSSSEESSSAEASDNVSASSQAVTVESQVAVNPAT